MRKLLVTIIGASGTGKSKLALQLARKYNGEIISADSMQIYKGLDIISNKPSKTELASCPHHLIDCVDPYETIFDVHLFKKSALPVISEIFDRERTPFIVGGTHYYIEAALWDFLVDEPDQYSQSSKAPYPDADYDRLKEVDPDTAMRLHPNNSRKISRALQVFDRHGETLSSILKRQHKGSKKDFSGGLRFENNLMLWVRCDQNVLDKRVDDRLDEMVANCLGKELEHFYDTCGSDATRGNTKGVLQIIGFKEFADWLALDKTERLSEKGKDLFSQSVELSKIATRQYCRKQVKWIRNRFMKRRYDKIPDFYWLDSTDSTKWDRDVFDKACMIMDASLAGETFPENMVQLDPSNKSMVVHKTCDVCQRVFIFEHEWEGHLKSRSHRKAVLWSRKQNEDGVGR